MSDVFFYVFFVCAGCLLGMAARYLANKVKKERKSGFPWLTLIVDTVCCFYIGVFWGLFSKSLSDASQVFILLSVGFLGGFTPPYIAYEESLPLLREGKYITVLLDVVGTIVLAIGAAIAGFLLAR